MHFPDYYIVRISLLSHMAKDDDLYNVYSHDGYMLEEQRSCVSYLKQHLYQ